MNVDISIGPNVRVHTTRESLKNVLDQKTGKLIESLLSHIIPPCNRVSTRVAGVDYTVRVQP